MPYLELNCGLNAGNTGIQDCVENFGSWDKIIVCPDDTEISSKETALLEATWETLINASKSSRIYPLFEHFNAEPDQEERVQEDGWAGKSETVREGKDKITFIFQNISFYNHKELRKHNGRTNIAIYIVTSKGYILGRTDDNIKFKPLTLSDFYVDKRNFSDGSTIDRTKVRIEFKDASQWNDNGVWVKPSDFDPLLLDGIKDVNLSGTLLVAGMTLSVTSVTGSGIAGLVAANFDFHLDADPLTPIAVTVDTDHGDGTYTLSWADQTGNGAATLTLFEQPIGTSGYEANPNGTDGQVSAIL